MRHAHVLAVLSAALAFTWPRPAQAGCGCAKPPPPRAVVRPFVGHTDSLISIFDDRLEPGRRYPVQFESTTDGSSDWSLAEAVLARDLADGEARPQLRVRVGAVGLGPCRISVWADDPASPLLVTDDDQFTVTARPIALYDFAASFTRSGYRAGVGRDGSVYLPVDVTHVTDPTTFTAVAVGFPMRFADTDVSLYNDQGFLMEVSDPSHWKPYGVTPNPLVVAKNAGTLPAPAPVPVQPDMPTTSSLFTYWRHEFQTYKDQHRKDEALETDDDPNWHNDGTAHVNHDQLVAVIKATLPDGTTPTPGASPVFDLFVASVPDSPGPTATPVPEGELGVINNPAPNGPSDGSGVSGRPTTDPPSAPGKHRKHRSRKRCR